MESEQTEILDPENRLVVARGAWREGSKMGDDNQRAQTSGYKTNKSYGYNAQHDDCSQQYCVVCLKIAVSR